MPFVDVIQAERAEGLTREQYAADQSSLGYVPNYTRAFSLRPNVYSVWQELIKTIRSNMRLRRYELVTIATALALGCDYCTLAHGTILRKNFLDADQLRAVVCDFRNADLEPQEVAVMEFSQKVATQANSIRDQDTAALRAHGLSDAEILDVILAVAARNFFSTVLLATGAEPDEVYADLQAELGPYAKPSPR